MINTKPIYTIKNGPVTEKYKLEFSSRIIKLFCDFIVKPIKQADERSIHHMLLGQKAQIEADLIGKK